VGGGEESIYPVLKVPRQCPLALLVEVMHLNGINLVCRWMGCIIMKFGLILGVLYWGEILMSFVGLHLKQAAQRTICVSTEHVL
jgi:hypothetical protein